MGYSCRSEGFLTPTTATVVRLARSLIACLLKIGAPFLRVQQQVHDSDVVVIRIAARHRVRYEGSKARFPRRTGTGRGNRFLARGDGDSHATVTRRARTPT